MTTDVVTPLGDDAALAYTQGMRQRLINEIIAKGIPQDDDSQKMLLAALDGMDRNALGTKRLQAEDRNADADRQAALLIVEMQAQLGAVNPYLRGVVGDNVPAHPDVLLATVELVPGELDTTPIASNFKDFTSPKEV